MRSKPVLGLLLGGLLGVFDGLTALFTPAARSIIATIVIGSTFKGVVTGLIAGLIARKLHSIPLGILCGLVIGLILSYWVAVTSPIEGKYFYFEIMLPGSILGAIVGFATQKYPAQTSA
jgi:uncharacterized membrane protein HdeD (DUF308 family)